MSDPFLFLHAGICIRRSNFSFQIFTMRFSKNYTLKSVLPGILLSACTMGLHAQDCNAHFEVNAGPDINVCETGSVNLGATTGGDVTRASWHGGKGTFVPNRNTLDA